MPYSADAVDRLYLQRRFQGWLHEYYVADPQQGHVLPLTGITLAILLA